MRLVDAEGEEEGLAVAFIEHAQGFGGVDAVGLVGVGALGGAPFTPFEAAFRQVAAFALEADRGGGVKAVGEVIP